MTQRRPTARWRPTWDWDRARAPAQAGRTRRISGTCGARSLSAHARHGQRMYARASCSRARPRRGRRPFLSRARASRTPTATRAAAAATAGGAGPARALSGHARVRSYGCRGSGCCCCCCRRAAQTKTGRTGGEAREAKGRAPLPAGLCPSGHSSGCGSFDRPGLGQRPRSAIPWWTVQGRVCACCISRERRSPRDAGKHVPRGLSPLPKRQFNKTKQRKAPDPPPPPTLHARPAPPPRYARAGPRSSRPRPR
jgi:hypothetical protein